MKISGMTRPMKRTGRARAGITAIVVAASATVILATPSAGEAQVRTISWTEVTSVEMPGLLGSALRATGVLNDRRTEHAIHRHGRILRQDDGESSVIMDLENGRIIHVDHATETYLEMTFEETTEIARELTEVLAEAQAGADDALREAQAEYDEAMEELRQAMEEAQESFRVQVSATATGETRQFGSMSADRHIIRAEVEAIDGLEGMEGGADGALVFLMELWQTRDFPEADDLWEEWARELAEDPAMQELANEIAESMGGISEDTGAEMLAAWDPRIAAGVQQMIEVAESLEGTSLMSRTVIAAVEPGATVDQEELIAWEPGSLTDGLREQVADQAAEQVRDGAREATGAALRGLSRGLLGRRGGNEPEPEAEEAPPRVRPMVRYTSMKDNAIVTTSPAEANSLFGEESSYRRLTLDDLISGAMAPPPGG